MTIKDNLLNKYKELAKINSYSKKERNLFSALYSELLDMGCKVREDNTAAKINGDTGNLIADLPGNPDYPAILLSAHMDRIDSSNNIKINLSNDIIEGYRKSPGGDDLTGIVTILEIIKQLNQNISDHPGLKIIFTVAEELGLLGSQHLSADEVESIDYGLVYDAEGKTGTVIYSSPAFVSLNISLTARKKKEAYKIATSIISKLELGQIDSETEVRISVENKSGEQGDFHPIKMKSKVTSYRRKKLKNEIDKIKKTIRDISVKYNCKVKFNIINFYNGFSLNTDSKLIILLKKAAAGCDIDLELLKKNGGSDANNFNKLGVPTVNLGTGLRNAHTSREKVDINEMVKLVEYSLAILNKARDYSHV